MRDRKQNTQKQQERWQGKSGEMSEKDWIGGKRANGDLARGDLKAVLLTPGECYSCPG